MPAIYHTNTFSDAVYHMVARLYSSDCAQVAYQLPNQNFVVFDFNMHSVLPNKLPIHALLDYDSGVSSLSIFEHTSEGRVMVHNYDVVIEY